MNALKATAQTGPEEAKRWLEKAIARHKRHMNGKEPTTDASQRTMMDEMMKALAALEDDPPKWWWHQRSMMS